MKILTYIKILAGALIIMTSGQINAQATAQLAEDKKEYNNLEEALKSPQRVLRLNLSGQELSSFADSLWGKFENLEYLSLKNDHLKEIPAGIGNLKKLKTLDLSNNDFTSLPKSFSKLENLREIYLNDEKNMDIDQSLRVIKDLPNLRILHLENDNLKNLPQSLLQFKQLEKLYLNNNRFSQIPIDLKRLKNLKYIDFHDNKFRLENHSSEMPFQGSGIIMVF